MRCSTTSIASLQAPCVQADEFSVQPLCSLCLCGVLLLGIHQPQRHREHRGCTEIQTSQSRDVLTLVKVRVGTTRGEKALVCAALDDATVCKRKNLIGTPDQ